jgi:hypothetical protein
MHLGAPNILLLTLSLTGELNGFLEFASALQQWE